MELAFLVKKTHLKCIFLWNIGLFRIFLPNFVLRNYIGKDRFAKYPSIFDVAPFRERASFFNSEKSTEFEMKNSFI